MLSASEEGRRAKPSAYRLTGKDADEQFNL
jgi:hypothetical protein